MALPQFWPPSISSGVKSVVAPSGLTRHKTGDGSCNREIRVVLGILLFPCIQYLLSFTTIIVPVLECQCGKWSVTWQRWYIIPPNMWYHIVSMYIDHYHIVSMYIDHYVRVVSQSILRTWRNQLPLLDNRRSVVLHRFTRITYSILNCNKPLACWQQITMNTSTNQKSSEYTACNRAKRHPDTEPTQMSTSIKYEIITEQCTQNPWCINYPRDPHDIHFAYRTFTKYAYKKSMESCCAICSSRI